MFMKIKKMGALLLTIVIVITTLVGCSSSKKNDIKDLPASKDSTTSTSSSGSNPNETKSGYQTTYGSKVFDNVTITVEVFDRSNAPEGSSVLDNKWTQYINEAMNKVGITVEFVAVPRSEEVSKVQLMMSAGTAPDVMLTYSTSVVEDFYNQGGTYDLSPYIDGADQATNLKAYIGEDCLNLARKPDNSLWAVCARRSTTAQTNIFIRKDWLDALGMKIPTTVDEMYDVLVAFKNNNPEGRSDVIASSFWTGGAGPMAHAFLDSVVDEKEYNISFSPISSLVYSDDGYVEYLRWMNKLYNEGLMDKEYYVNNDFGQTLKEYIVNGQVGVFETDVNYNVDNLRGSLLQNLKLNNPAAEIVSIEPLKNTNDGKVYNNGYPINGAYVFVPKTCENVEAVVTYLDWLSTKEGGFAIFHGFEGEHFNYDENGVPVVKDSEYNSIDKDWTRHDLFLVGNQGYYATQKDFSLATSKETPGYEDYVVSNYANATAGIARNLPTFSSPTATENTTELGLITDEYFVKCITCPPDEFDNNIAEFRKQLESCEIQTILDERTAFYNKEFGE